MDNISEHSKFKLLIQMEHGPIQASGKRWKTVWARELRRQGASFGLAACHRGLPKY